MTKIRSRSDVLTKSFLEECFEVNFETGTLTWKRRPRHHFPTERGWKIANAQRAGKKANLDWYKSENYSCERVTTCGMHMPVHHVIWVMFYGEVFDKTKYEIDHIDRNPRNNSIGNLRCVTSTENSYNTSGKIHGKTSDFKGLCYDKEREKLMLQIKLEDFKISARFDCEKSAAYVYKVLSENYHGDYSPEFLGDVEFPRSFDMGGLTTKVRKRLLDCSDEIKQRHSDLFNLIGGKRVVYAVKKTNTGVPRVSLTNDKAIPNRDGRKFVARNEHGVSKTYTVSKYGYDEAFRLACEWVNNSPSGLKGRT